MSDDLVDRLQEMARYRNATRQDWTREMEEAAATITQLRADLAAANERAEKAEAAGYRRGWADGFAAGQGGGFVDMDAALAPSAPDEGAKETAHNDAGVTVQDVLKAVTHG